MSDDTRSKNGPFDLATRPLHLGLGGTAAAQPEFSGMAWYQAYEVRTAADGGDGRLVAFHEMSESWTSWEMHPKGEEVVLCMSGRFTLVQEREDGSHVRLDLAAGDYAINPRGTWHTADIGASGEPVRALFLTPGQGTAHRPR